MKKIMKRMFALLLALVLVAGMVPHYAVEASAEGNLSATSGVYTVTLERFTPYGSDKIKMVSSIEISSFNITSKKIMIDMKIKVQSDGTYIYSFTFDNKPCTELLNSTVPEFSAGHARLNLRRDAQESHTGDTATCVNKAVCTVCKQEYGDHNYTYSASGATITETCNNGCGHNLTATLRVKDGADLTYTDKAIEPCEIDYPAGWVGTQVQPDSGSYTDNVNAGTATVKATVENMELTTSFDIEPYDISGEKVTVEFTPSSATYTGQEQKPTYAVKFGDAPMVENADYTATWSVGEFINAGDYRLVLNGKDGSNFTGTKSATYTIGKATPTFTAPKAKELTYTGQALPLVEAGSTDVGEMQYSGSEDGTYGTDIPVGTDAGEYTVWYKVVVEESNPNYTSTEPASVEVTIGKAAPDVAEPTAKTGLVYDGSEQELVDASSTTGKYQFRLSENDSWSEAIPKAVTAGDHAVYWKFIPTDSENYTEVECTEPVTATIAKAKLTPRIEGLPADGGKVTKVYDGTTTLPENHGLSIQWDGAEGNDDIGVDGVFAYAGADAGEQTIKAVLTLTGADAANYELTTTEVSADAGEITRLTVTDSAAITAGEALTWDGTEQTATIKTITQDGLDVTYELTGNKATDVGAHKMKLTGTGNFTGELELEFYILPDEDILEGITEGNVTTEDLATIDKAKEMVESADTSGLPEEQKAALDAALEEISDKVEVLEEKLDAAMDAADTEDVNKALAITADKAKASDKQTLQDAKADLEEALTTYATNYTVEEQKLLEGEIDRLEAILADIADAEETVKAVEALPDSVSPDDTKTGAKIDEAQKLYDALTAGQKQIVDNSTGKKLEKLQAELLDIDKIKGSGRWTKTSGKDLAFVFNGPYDSFDHVEVDGKEVNAKHYTVTEGSTVITFKNAYLEKLSYGKHKLVAVYKIDGQEVRSDADGEVVNIQVLKYATNAATGDMFNVALWAGIALVAAAAAVVLLVLMKKKEKK